MSGKITKEDIIRLSKLARINLQGEEDKILEDAWRILAYFEELQEVDIHNASKASSATAIINVASEDKINQDLSQKGIGHFAILENGCLKIPGVMHNINKE